MSHMSAEAKLIADRIQERKEELWPEKPATELQYVNLIIDAQRANGSPVDPAGAKRLVIALRAVGLIKFD
jgi:hypothetical protein